MRCRSVRFWNWNAGWEHGRWVSGDGQTKFGLNSAWRIKPLYDKSKLGRAAALMQHTFLSLPRHLRQRSLQIERATSGYLANLIDRWSDAASLSDEAFREHYLGHGVDLMSSRLLRQAIERAANASNNGEMAEASRSLAAAVQAIGIGRWSGLLQAVAAKATALSNASTSSPYNSELGPTQFSIGKVAQAKSERGSPLRWISDEQKSPPSVGRNGGPPTDAGDLPELPEGRPPTKREINSRGSALTRRLDRQIRAGTLNKNQAIGQFLEKAGLGDWRQELGRTVRIRPAHLTEIRGAEMTQKLEDLTDDALVDLFEKWAYEQGQALLEFDTAAATQAYRKRDEVYEELKARGVEARSKLLRLLDHEDPAVRLYAAKRLLAVAPDRARSALEDIIKHADISFAGDAGFTLDMFDEKNVKPD